VALLGEYCDAGWHYYDGSHSCFFVSTTEENMDDARAECRSMSADLASISDQAEMDFVTSIS